MTNQLFESEISRRDALKLGMSSALALGVAACGGSAAIPSSAPTAEAAAPPVSLIKAAQAEGMVNFYCAAVPNAMSLLVAGFSSRYGIQVNANRIISAPLEVKVSAEIQSGKPVADVIQLSDAAWVTSTAGPKGWLLKPDATNVPAIANWPSAFILDKDGTTYAQSLGLYDIGYNTDIVKGSEVPKSWSDVLNPKWSGRLMIVDPRNNSTNLAWYYFLQQHLGDSFLSKLAAMKPKLTLTLVSGINSVASGDVAMMIPSQRWSSAPLLSAGAPIADAYVSPTTAAVEYMAILKNSPHPNAAQLFMNYALSGAGQVTECKDLCTSVLSVPGTIPFPKGYEDLKIDEAGSNKAKLLSLLGVS